MCCLFLLQSVSIMENNIKFNVCHVPTEPPYTPNNICTKGSAVPAHLIPGSTGHHNCTLGPCGQQLCFSTTSASAHKEITSTEKVVEIKDDFTVMALSQSKHKRF